MALTPCADLSAASWLTGSTLPWHRLVTLGPAGLPAYARLRFLPDPAYPGQREADATLLPEGSPTETEQLRTAATTLARWTRTPDDCWFCLWDGWHTDLAGDPGRGRVPAFPSSVLEGPRVEVTERAFFLFRGPLVELGEWGAADEAPGRPRVHLPPPAFVWPADRAWCIARDVDPHWAGIGAGAAAVAELVADPRLDVVPADPEVEPPSYR